MSRLALALAFCCLPLLGCDLASSAGATIVVSGLLVKTPEMKLAGQFDVPGEVGTTVWVGERASATDTNAPTPIKGASVAVTFAGNRVAVPEEGKMDGLYVQSSVEDLNLVYAPGAAYTFEAKIPDSDALYGGTVKEAPEALSPAGMMFEPEPTVTAPNLPEVGVHAQGAPLTLRWGPQFGTHAFVTVVRADPQSPNDPQVVFDSRPKTAEEIIKFIAGTPPESILIPGDTFRSDGIYAIVLVVCDQGEPLSSTFLGSPLLVGSGAARFLAVGF
jgi:hypothetical protein